MEYLGGGSALDIVSALHEGPVQYTHFLLSYALTVYLSFSSNIGVYHIYLFLRTTVVNL